jgi:hypothetical protein
MVDGEIDTTLTAVFMILRSTISTRKVVQEVSIIKLRVPRHCTRTVVPGDFFKIRNLVSRCSKWCPGPESNRHSISTEGF